MAKKSHPAKRHARRGAPLDTAEGTQEAREAALWWMNFNRQTGGKDVIQPVQEPVDEMAATRRLPGYPEALESARHALFELWGRIPMVREMHQAARAYGESSMEFTSAALLALAGYGDGTHGPALPDALRWHDGRGSREAFVRELNERQANALKKPLPRSKAPSADLPPVQSMLIVNWVSAGFWLTSSRDGAAILHGQSLVSGRGKSVPVTAENFARIVQDFRLVSYRTFGEGHLLFKDGGLAADQKLLDELRQVSEQKNILDVKF